MTDPELEQLFTDPGDLEVINLLQSSRPASPPLDPHFRNYLRAKLMTEARNALTPPARRRWFQLGPAGMVPAMAAVAAGFLIVLGVQVYLQRQPTSTPQVAVNLTAIDNKVVAPAEPIQIPFTGPLDKTAIQDSVVIQPATSFTQRWEGQTLVITPAHPLAPNTSYRVTLQPKATAPAQAPSSTPPAQRPVVVHFLTAPGAVPQVLAPSFKSGSVGYAYDNRIPDSNRLSNPTWTVDGQLLVTRPTDTASPSARTSPSATATAAATPAAASAGPTDIWLMTTQGTLLRVVAPGGSYAAVAPAGGVFADWQERSPDQSTLEVRDLQGVVRAPRLATVTGRPERAPLWLGSDRIAYLENGSLRVVDLHGTSIALPELHVTGPMAASASGLLLALKLDSGSVVLDLSAIKTSLLPVGATGFAWSPSGKLAFTMARAGGTDLYSGADAHSARMIASSATGESWSDLNWAPDSTSLLLASRSDSGSKHSRLLLINADGSSPAGFGSAQVDYLSPLWSPHGDLVLFARQDEAGGLSLWTAKARIGQPSATDTAESQALAEVTRFMQARINGDPTAAQAELDASAQQAYASGASSLLSPGGRFVRYYPVSVQLATANKFLIGARLFIAKNGVETSFFEEQLTLLLVDQRYVIDAVSATPAVQLGHGPTVVRVEVRQVGSGQQVMVRFDSDLKPETVSADTVLIRDAKGTDVTARVSFDPDAHLVTLDTRLRPGSYSLVVTTGLSDINGSPVAQPYSYSLLIGG